MDKSRLLDAVHAAGEDRLLLAKVLDRVEQAQGRNIPAATDLMSHAQQAQVQDLLHLAGISETAWVKLGGYDGAERNLFLFLPDWLDVDLAGSYSPLRCLRATFRAEDGLSHRDFLGSLMGMGVAREKVGDILVSEESADLIVLDTVAAFLISSWDCVGRVKLRVTEIDPAHIHIPTAKVQEVRDTVSSLRLDAVAAVGFRLARGKAADLVRAGKVQVNWRECTKGDRLLAVGDSVSARGFGKFELTEVGSVTRKGRTAIVIRRYI